LSKGAEYVLSLPVLLAFLALYLLNGQAHLNGWLILFPFGVALEFAALVGIGLILAPVTALVTDVQRVVRIALRMLFYGTPVVYTTHIVPQPYDKILWANPLTGILEMMRAGFFRHDRYPLMWGPIGVAAVMSIGLLLVGVSAFGRMERAVLKEI
jgi:ABC-2 type transport system permease protein